MCDRAKRCLQIVRRGKGEFLEIGIGSCQFLSLLLLLQLDFAPGGDIDDGGEHHRLAIDGDRIESDL